MAVPRIPLRIAVVQFSPKVCQESSLPFYVLEEFQIGQVQANMTRIRDLCAKLGPRSVDLVCLPEMAFTGYAFTSAEHISPYLEAPKTGPTSRFCSELAERLRCYVFAGYPERLTPDELLTHQDTEDISSDSKTSPVGANSAVLYGPDGQWVGAYRKTNLYETDMTWARKGTGFATFSLPSPLRTVSLGICMDLNAQPPAIWTLEDGPYELADYALQQSSNVLILLNAWLDSGEASEEEQDWRTLNFWAARLRPLWADAGSKSDGASPEELTDEDSHNGKETIVVICNRSGEENGKLFAGTSAIFSMKQGFGRPKLLDMMDRQEEGVRVWNILV